MLARRVLPLMLKRLLWVSPVPATRVKVKVSPTSGSVAVSVPTVALAPPAWSTLLLLRVMSVGAAFITAV